MKNRNKTSQPFRKRKLTETLMGFWILGMGPVFLLKIIFDIANIADNFYVNLVCLLYIIVMFIITLKKSIKYDIDAKYYSANYLNK